MKKNNNITVSFSIDRDDFKRFSLLESVATSQNDSIISLLLAIYNKCDEIPRRKFTPEERQQRADWMEMDLEDIAE